MDRMSPLDAAFLQAEDEEPGVSLAIASIAVFAGPPPTTEEFAAHLRGRLPLVPRYRQKAREVPLDLGPPVWVDDPGFRLESHLRRTALPRPGGDRELADLMGEVVSGRLDRDRPLWDYWLVEGLADDRWALVSKVHHCMVDGISGTDLYRVILDESPTPREPVPDDWHPGPEPSSLQLATAALLDLGHLPLEQARALAGAVRHPAELTSQVGATLRGLTALTGALRPASRSSLTGPPSARRHFAFTRAAVADVSAVRAALGGTFNDVVLAAITAGFRRLLLSHGEVPTGHTVRSLVPVSVRAPGSESVRGNEISLMLAELPVHLSDPVEQLAAVRHHLADLKAEHEADAGAAVVRLARQEPFPVVAAPVRWAAHLPQRSVVTVTTDVPGPRRPLYALGRRLLEVVPYVPIASSLRTGVAVFSYCGQVTFGVTGDRDAADVWTLAEGVDEGLARLVAAAGGGRPAGPATTAGRRPRQGSRARTRPRDAHPGRQDDAATAPRPPAGPVAPVPAETPAPVPPGWRLVREDTGVTAVDPRGPVATVRISEDGERVCLEFELTTAALPADVGVELTRAVFEHAALSPRRPVLATVPRGAGDVLEEVRRHVPGARTHVAGSTCMVRGRLR